MSAIADVPVTCPECGMEVVLPMTASTPVIADSSHLGSVVVVLTADSHRYLAHVMSHADGAS